MIIDDTIASVFLGGIAAMVMWCLRKLNKLAIDVALIKQKLHMR
jgi:hypothetical protein